MSRIEVLLQASREEMGQRNHEQRKSHTPDPSASEGHQGTEERGKGKGGGKGGGGVTKKNPLWAALLDSNN